MLTRHFVRALPSLLFATSIAACGPTGRISPSDGGVDLRGSGDLAGRLDFAAVRDLSAPEDLAEPPDLAQGRCSIVGDWDLGGGFVITLDAKGNLTVMGQAFGAYTFAGTTLSITDDSSPECMMPGKYAIAFSPNCTTVTATKLSEPCAPRAMALTAAMWIRQ